MMYAALEIKWEPGNTHAHYLQAYELLSFMRAKLGAKMFAQVCGSDSESVCIVGLNPVNLLYCLVFAGMI